MNRQRRGEIRKRAQAAAALILEQALDSDLAITYEFSDEKEIAEFEAEIKRCVRRCARGSR